MMAWARGSRYPNVHESRCLVSSDYSIRTRFVPMADLEE